MHPHTTRLSPTDLPGRRSAEDPGAPLLSAVRVSPSPQQPPGSGAAKFRKTPRLPARWKTTCRRCLKTTLRKSLHQAGTPQLGNAVKMARIQALREVHQIGVKNARKEKDSSARSTTTKTSNKTKNKGGAEPRHPQGVPTVPAETSNNTTNHEDERRQPRRPPRVATRRATKKPRQTRPKSRKGQTRRTRRGGRQEPQEDRRRQTSTIANAHVDRIQE